MPPAFNLSQDQTLQFKSQNSRSTRYQPQNSNPGSTPEPSSQNQQLNFRASPSISRQPAQNSRKPPPDQEPTPIGCLIFKELQAGPEARLRCCPSSKRGALYRRFPVRQHLLRRKWQLRPETARFRNDEGPGVGARCLRWLEPRLVNAADGRSENRLRLVDRSNSFAGSHGGKQRRAAACPRPPARCKALPERAPCSHQALYALVTGSLHRALVPAHPQAS